MYMVLCICMYILHNVSDNNIYIQLLFNITTNIILLHWLSSCRHFVLAIGQVRLL